MKKMYVVILFVSAAIFFLASISFAEEMPSETYEFTDEPDGDVLISFPERVTKRDTSTCLGNFSIYTKIYHDALGNAYLEYQKVETPLGSIFQWMDGESKNNELLVDIITIDGKVFLVSASGIYPYDPVQDEILAATFYQSGNYFMSPVYYLHEHNFGRVDVYLPYYSEENFRFLGFVHYQNGIWQLVDYLGPEINSWVGSNHILASQSMANYDLLLTSYVDLQMDGENEGLLLFDPFTNEFTDIGLGYLIVIKYYDHEFGGKVAYEVILDPQAAGERYKEVIEM